MDVWRSLVQDIKFKDTSGEDRKLVPRTQTVKRKATPATNDTLESANVFRKANNIRVHGDNVPTPAQAFKKLLAKQRLPKALLLALPAIGLERPTAVQSQVLPILLDGRDVLAISPTGSGKTLAFVLPILADILKSTGHSKPYALLLAPSRELVQQTTRVVDAFKPLLAVKLVCTSITQASAAGSDFRKVDIVVTTPLRIGRLVQRKKIDLAPVQHLVLDEADKLLELKDTRSTVSNLHQVDKIMGACTHPGLVTGIFSATIPDTVESLARTFLKDPVRVTVGDRNATAFNIRQQLQFAGSEEGKVLLLQQQLAEGMQAPVLIFVASKEKAVILQRKLVGYRVDSIFSSKDYRMRQKALDTFRAGETWLLISTDVLARGIDFVGIKTVVNYDCPASLDDYVHRIGRTGRGGSSGAAMTFFTEEDGKVVRSIAHMIASMGQDVPQWMLGMSKAAPDRPQKRRKH